MEATRASSPRSDACSASFLTWPRRSSAYILCPKLSIFFLAVLPQFVRTGEPEPLARMLALSAVFMLITFVVFPGYGLLTAPVRDRLLAQPRVMTWMRRTFAAHSSRWV